VREGGDTLVITIIRDVSERRAAETRFRALLESAPDKPFTREELSGRVAEVISEDGG
jgi:hypothetical protein